MAWGDWASWGKTALDTYSSYSNSKSGGTSASGSGSSDNIWGSILGGLSGAAGAVLSSKDAKDLLEIKSKDDRRNIQFEAELVDYYKQLDKSRKRKALDVYNSYGYGPTAPALDMPAKPTV